MTKKIHGEFFNNDNLNDFHYKPINKMTFGPKLVLEIKLKSASQIYA
jgi:hypothetical protein